MTSPIPDTGELTALRALSEKVRVYVQACDALKAGGRMFHTDPVSQVLREAEESGGVYVSVQEAEKLMRLNEAMVKAHDEMIAAWRALSHKGGPSGASETPRKHGSSQ